MGQPDSEKSGKRYFRMPGEPPIGSNMRAGMHYVEFDGDWASRQIEEYDGEYYTSSLERPYHPGLGIGLVDQPLSKMDVNHPMITEITAEEFEEAWRRAGGK